MATVFASGCFRTETRTAGAPSSRVQSRCSRCVSRTLATSESGTRPPPAIGTGSARIWSTLVKRPAVLPTTSRVLEVTRPADTSRLPSRSAAVTWPTVRP
jgi:hypothetical protein